MNLQRLPSPDEGDVMGLRWALAEGWDFYEVTNDEDNKKKVASVAKELYARLSHMNPETQEFREMVVVGAYTAKKGMAATHRERRIDDNDAIDRIAVFCHKEGKSNSDAAWKPLFAVQIFSNCKLVSLATFTFTFTTLIFVFIHAISSTSMKTNIRSELSSMTDLMSWV